MKYIYYTIILILILLPIDSLYGQRVSVKNFKPIADSIQSYLEPFAEIKGKIAIKSVSRYGKTIKIVFNNTLSEYPFRNENIQKIYSIAKRNLPTTYKKLTPLLYSNQNLIDNYIPLFYQKKNPSKTFVKNKNGARLITKYSTPYTVTNGLQNKHLAIMQSHGRYYNNDKDNWIWQRARINETVEDLYTSSFVLPFLTPMLENAGATVFMPRERDFNNYEILVDNDIQGSGYNENIGKVAWQSGTKSGFGNPKPYYISGENPFQMGSSRMVTSITSGKESFAEWIPTIPEDGDYGVYISYQTYPNSSKDVEYTVIHTGGKTIFSIDQTMGGGTWIYLGKFNFKAGSSQSGMVKLSNKSDIAGKIISADAVKIGGGMGNIARFKSEESPFHKNINSRNKEDKITDTDKKIQFTLPSGTTPKTSGYPRYTEGARYWLQWAGFEDSIYTPNANMNDYNDDFMCRGLWVNCLNKSIPIDLALAFHSDAGTTSGDSIVGTLGIYRSISEDSKFYPTGESRLTSRYMTDMIQTQIVEDISRIYGVKWSRRGMWDKSYHEARTPEVPTMLLEILSHQNFADMRYGLDPSFRFIVSRAVYKGILKYLSHKEGRQYTIQPLPVKQFSAILNGNKAVLQWIPVKDTLETTADAKRYVLYTKKGDNGFDNGVLLSDNRYEIPIMYDTVYSFKVTAINAGGESFPSETLSLCKLEKENGNVLIVNGFTKIGPPKNFAIDTLVAGFLDSIDSGTPYLYNLSYTGRQYEFRKTEPWISDDNPGYGASFGNYETQVIAGNNFSYPLSHGKAFVEAGYSFSSCSTAYFGNTQLALNQFSIIDIILGKQRESDDPDEIKNLKNRIENYSANGGNILFSAANIEDTLFSSDILKCKPRQLIYESGNVGKYKFSTKPNTKRYSVESCTELIPTDNNTSSILWYSDDHKSAAVSFQGRYNAITIGFPIEALLDQYQINSLIKELLEIWNR